MWRIDHIFYTVHLYIPISKLLYVVKQTPASFLAAAALLPQYAGGVDEVTEQDGRGDIPEQTEYHELHAEGKRALLFAYRSIT